MWGKASRGDAQPPWEAFLVVRRKVTGTPGFIVACPQTTTRDGGRPAQLYRAGEATLLHPAMLRP